MESSDTKHHVHGIGLVGMALQPVNNKYFSIETSIYNKILKDGLRFIN